MFKINNKNININSVYSSVSAINVDIPELGNIAHYEENQRITFVGPTFATRYDTNKWLIYL